MSRVRLVAYGRLVRVLFTCRPTDGHYYPMVPLIEALVGAGDDVAVATAEPLLGFVEAAGVQAFSAGLAGDDPIVLRHRNFAVGLPATEIRRFAFTDIFVGVEMPPRLEDLDAVFKVFRPDLVVHEIAEFAAPIAATAHGVPYATHSFGPLLQPDVAVLAGAAAAPFWRQRGLDPHRLAGLYQHLYLDICPPSMQIAAINDLEAVQPLGRADITSAPGDLAWIDELSDRPIVYVTLGTIYNRDASIFQTILAGLVDHDVSVVVTVGRDNDPAMLGPQPAHVVVRRFVPQAALLPRCSMVVTHGGAGSVLGALSFGLPLLVVPQSADQFYNAERVVAAGAGVSLTPPDLTEAAVRSAVRQLVEDQTYRQAAQRIKTECDAMPDPASIRPRLVQLASPT